MDLLEAQQQRLAQVNELDEMRQNEIQQTRLFQK
jgi:hypothetical protein